MTLKRSKEYIHDDAFSRRSLRLPGEVHGAEWVQVRAQVRQGQGPRLRHRRTHLPQQVFPPGRILRVSTVTVHFTL